MNTVWLHNFYIVLLVVLDFLYCIKYYSHCGRFRKLHKQKLPYLVYRSVTIARIAKYIGI
jgi:hypothetical protein